MKTEPGNAIEYSQKQRVMARNIVGYMPNLVTTNGCVFVREIEKAMDEYAEEYAKAFYSKMVYNTSGYLPDPDDVDKQLKWFKESLKK